ncbi:hypothetical protein OEZ85_014055 [Tetradesmus obliquus]|uniref:Uncharacterized protein n=1 Tax=Tetradesmus obliquus TaxID=3088 RepID=A0ABY8U6S5_TETOB|nr:hypothetical protein OEZ85_014055 [Tetradesmus obliquus]
MHGPSTPVSEQPQAGWYLPAAYGGLVDVPAALQAAQQNQPLSLGTHGLGNHPMGVLRFSHHRTDAEGVWSQDSIAQMYRVALQATIEGGLLTGVPIWKQQDPCAAFVPSYGRPAITQPLEELSSAALAERCARVSLFSFTLKPAGEDLVGYSPVLQMTAVFRQASRLASSAALREMLEVQTISPTSIGGVYLLQ